jgi:hypothetical protein
MHLPELPKHNLEIDEASSLVAIRIRQTLAALLWSCL